MATQKKAKPTNDEILTILKDWADQYKDDQIKDGPKHVLKHPNTIIGFTTNTGSTIKIFCGSRVLTREHFGKMLKLHGITFEERAVSGSSFAGTAFKLEGRDLQVMYKAKRESNPSTAQQERGAAYVFDQALAHNVHYTNAADILTKSGPGLMKAMDVSSGPFPYDDWLESFFLQQQKLLQTYSAARFKLFNRDGGFMDWISKFINSQFGIVKKDTWNPADVWAISGEVSDIETKLVKSVEAIPPISKLATNYGRGTYLFNQKLRQGILAFNATMVDLLEKNILVGISLKKSSGTVKLEVINASVVKLFKNSNTDLIDTAHEPYECDPGRGDIVCSFLKQSKGESFTQDAKITVHNGGDKISFQIKANSSQATNGSNLKFESTIGGSSNARGGKVPLETVELLLKKASTLSVDGFTNDHRKYPKTTEQFEKQKRMYVGIFNAVKAQSVQLGVSSDKDFERAVIDAFKAGGAIATNATCKLMSLHFIYMLTCKMDRSKMRTLLTDMAFLSQKINTRDYDTFGPFIKLS